MSQKQAILYFLKGGGKLTPLDALRRFGTLRLSGRILELREDGYPIKTTLIEVADGKHVAQYTLKRKAA